MATRRFLVTTEVVNELTHTVFLDEDLPDTVLQQEAYRLIDAVDVRLRHAKRTVITKIRKMEI